jgi:ribosomal protein S27AE
MDMRVCACGIRFTPNNYKQTRCNACRFGRQLENIPLKKRFCVRCGTVFDAIHRTGVYCSDDCHPRKTQNKACKHCGKSFYPVAHQQYCNECKTQNNRPSAYKKMDLPERPCKQCGKPFKPKRHASITCSELCYSRHYWESHSRFDRTPAGQSERRRAKLASVLRKHSGENKAS